ncbi:MAG: S49 family peptidase [Chromatiaceae bacterium]|jgi:protease-4
MARKDERNEGEWSRDLIERLATDSQKERRRTRRWGIFFKLLTFAYLAALLALLVPSKWSGSTIGDEPHTALVKLDGLIAPGEKASADKVVTGLRDAFEDENTKAVILRINSPGGSPVQSSYMHKEIIRLREEYPDIPLYAVVSDVCASGGYYVAAAADEIYVNESSLIGSIGVMVNGFGFVDAMEDLGIERRLITAGDHKGILDPFSPLNSFDAEHVEGLVDELHQTFIEAVKTGRGDKLKGTDDMLFSGLFWNGEEGIELGLADGIGSASYVAREIVGVEEIVDFTSTEDPLMRLVDRLGASIGRTLAQYAGMESPFSLR